MNELQKKQKISYQRDIKNNLWNALIVATGGTIGLMLSANNIFKIILVVVGFVLSFIFFNAYLTRGEFIEKLINNLEKGD